jgi:hypothetical protein
VTRVTLDRSAIAMASVLLLWQRNAPYLMTGTLLVVVSVVIGWTAHAREGFAVREAAARKRDA